MGPCDQGRAIYPVLFWRTGPRKIELGTSTGPTPVSCRQSDLWHHVYIWRSQGGAADSTANNRVYWSSDAWDFLCRRDARWSLLLELSGRKWVDRWRCFWAEGW